MGLLDVFKKKQTTEISRPQKPSLEQVVDQVEIRQADVRVLFNDATPEFHRLCMVGDVPVPGRMARRLLQDPLAVLLAGVEPHGLAREAGRLRLLFWVGVAY